MVGSNLPEPPSQSNHQLALLLDENGNIVSADERAARILSARRGAPFTDLAAPGQEPAVGAFLAQPRGEPRELELLVAGSPCALTCRARRLPQGVEVTIGMRKERTELRLLANAAHELRTPLNSIIGLTALLLDECDGALNQEQRRQVGYIRRSADALTDLVRDVLELYTLEAGGARLRAHVFSVASLFAVLHGMLRPLVHAHNPEVTLVFEDAESLPRLETDEAKVAQILRNLVSNALKFTESGEVRVSARAAAPDDTVVFAVTDSGIGIEPEDQERIFEELTQIDNPLQRRVPGTGLGLAVSRRLAELLEGSLTVTSQPGRGSTFFLAIPRVHPEAREMADLESGSHRPGEHDRDWAVNRLQVLGRERRIEKILLIDDDALSRYLIRKRLGRAPYTVLEATDSAEGLRLAREHLPDVIFLDLVMPRLSGFELLDELKRDPRTRTIPVVPTYRGSHG